MSITSTPQHTALHYTTLLYTTPHTTLQYYTINTHNTTHYITLHCTTRHTTLQYTTINTHNTTHHNTIHHITLHYTILHHDTPIERVRTSGMLRSGSGKSRIDFALASSFTVTTRAFARNSRDSSSGSRPEIPE